MGVDRRRAREKAERRAAILQAAAGVFLEKGISAASMDEIAERTEVSKGTVYLYFASKEDLFVAVVSETFAFLARLFEDAVTQSSSGVEALARLGRQYFRFCRDYPDRFRLAFLNDSPAFYGNVSAKSLQDRYEKQQECAGWLTHALDLAKEEDVLRPDVDTELTANLLFAHTTGVIMFFGDESKKSRNLWSAPPLRELVEVSLRNTLRPLVTSEESLQRIITLYNDAENE